MPLAWLRTRRQLARAAIVAVGLPLALAAAGSGAEAATVPSATAPFTLTVPYLCHFPVLGAQAIEATISGRAPQVVEPGQRFHLTDVRATTTVPASLVDALLLAHRSVSGRVASWSFTARGASPRRLGGTDSARLGPFTAGRDGQLTIAASNLELATWFGGLHCSARWAGHAPTLTIAVGSDPMPVNPAIGGLGVAALVSVALIWRQRRRTPQQRLAGADAASAAAWTATDGSRNRSTNR
ncbi:MAG TPA: DUF6801 domain-containing protein [Acidimicrobiales bacterium]|nr:DUF6801 domain-containing protein [Acidimicrobiales bacterium]